MYDKCKNFDLVTVTHKGNGHYHIQGKVLVNHYPNAKTQSAYINGTTGAVKNISPCEAIKLAIDPSRFNVHSAKRKSSYKKERIRLWNKSHTCGICKK